MTVGPDRLKDKVVVVTGATGGIGVEIVRRLADEGAHVVATDLDESACHDLLRTLARPERHAAHALDVASEDQWEAVFAATETSFGALHALINNAAIGSVATAEDETRARWDHVIGVGQTGTWLGMKHGGPLIGRSGGGSIVNMCSILGTVGGLGNSVAYAAAKGAVRTMTKNAALHWAKAGVRVNSLHPGFIGTAPLLERWEGSERHREMLAGTPMGRLGRGEEIAAAVAFLAGDDSSFVTGSEIYADGGWTAA
ncbi:MULTISPECIES: SDR family NAD(P)-dependent oxidoreductase [unclassified Rhodococcus (in: high G+C Gram-positive bacteria)]|uniref:SDR family NAD(P)-dependent oxidoreductase n=1 Tax=unclassified Rhodococcus (in: high G+C Gram-positive bacteria) TaxID=192944 RepID=UPI001639B7A6|nr:MULTISPECIES: SDR family oxidoreductase [unclassified Rhodococcus (in: high G+C Gram-positive bacteria)]MBC2639937.1 SDR family oxidoreductase [Rhodococcus sp. 3A]MBC2895316.1 SDR family oxidoreductase [Rhodococcus sp. 4CII]